MNKIGQTLVVKQILTVDKLKLNKSGHSYLEIIAEQNKINQFTAKGFKEVRNIMKMSVLLN